MEFPENRELPIFCISSVKNKILVNQIFKNQETISIEQNKESLFVFWLINEIQEDLFIG